MSKKNSQKEIEEAQKKVRGEPKSEEKKAEQKKDSSEKSIEKSLEKKERQETEKSEAELAEEQIQAEEQQKREKGADLEEITKGGARPIPAEAHDSPYVEQLSHRPMGDLYKEVKQLYQIAEDKGYLSPAEQKQAEYLSSAVQRKFEDEEQGIYSFSEEAARAASVTQQLSATMLGTYKGKKMSDSYQR